MRFFFFFFFCSVSYFKFVLKQFRVFRVIDRFSRLSYAGLNKKFIKIHRDPSRFIKIHKDPLSSFFSQDDAVYRYKIDCHDVSFSEEAISIEKGNKMVFMRGIVIVT